MICTTCARLSKYLLFFIAVFVCFSVTVYAHTAAPTDSTQSETSVPAIPDHILVALRETFFQNVIPLALPLVNNFLENTVIPAQKISVVEVEEIKFDSFAIGNVSLTMKEPNQIFVHAAGINAIIAPTKFKAKVIFITCEGTFEASLNNTKAMLPLRIIRLSNGTISVKTGKLEMDFGSFNIKYELATSGCRAMASIASALLGNMEKLMVDAVKAQMPEHVSPVVDEKANEFLSSLPIVLTRAPDVTSQQMKLSLDLFPDPNAVNASSDFPITEALPGRDAAVSITENPVNKVFKYFTIVNLLNYTVMFPVEYNSSLIKPMYPDAYKLCMDCNFALSFRAITPPMVKLQTEQTIMLHLTDFFVGLDLVPAGGGDPVYLVEISINMTGGVKDVGFTSDDKAIFKLSYLEKFSMGLLASNIGKLNLGALGDTALMMANYILVPLFNAQFEGIQLPSFVNDPVINMTLNEVIAGVNVKYDPMAVS